MKAFNINFEAKKTGKKKEISDVKKLDFSSIAGKLQWDGNGLAEKKKLEMNGASTPLSMTAFVQIEIINAHNHKSKKVHSYLPTWKEYLIIFENKLNKAIVSPSLLECQSERSRRKFLLKQVSRK